MKRGWDFEATSCPRDQTKLRKPNYKFTLRPSHVLYILLATVPIFAHCVFSLPLALVRNKVDAPTNLF